MSTLAWLWPLRFKWESSHDSHLCHTILNYASWPKNNGPENLIRTDKQTYNKTPFWVTPRNTFKEQYSSVFLLGNKTVKNQCLLKDWMTTCLRSWDMNAIGDAANPWRALAYLEFKQWWNVNVGLKWNYVALRKSPDNYKQHLFLGQR